jgi:hypothetical protein
MSLKGITNSQSTVNGEVSGSRNKVSCEVSGKYSMRPNVSVAQKIHGKSAYEIAVMLGFEGTEAEWLASLKGDTPVKGKDYFTEEDVNGIIEAVLRNIQPARIGEVTILANGWIGEASPYAQVVEVAGVTEYSQVDLTPSVEQLAAFHNKDLAFVTENDGGVVTVYAVGQKPQNDYTIQVTITEVGSWAEK